MCKEYKINMTANLLLKLLTSNNFNNYCVKKNMIILTLPLNISFKNYQRGFPVKMSSH